MQIGPQSWREILLKENREGMKEVWFRDLAVKVESSGHQILRNIKVAELVQFGAD